MFGFQKENMFIAAFPHPLPLSNIFLSSKDPPTILSVGVVWCTTFYDKMFIHWQVTLESFASFVFKNPIRDLVVTVVAELSLKEWGLCSVYDSGVDVIR